MSFTLSRPRVHGNDMNQNSDEEDHLEFSDYHAVFMVAFPQVTINPQKIDKEPCSKILTTFHPDNVLKYSPKILLQSLNELKRRDCLKKEDKIINNEIIENIELIFSRIEDEFEFTQSTYPDYPYSITENQDEADTSISDFLEEIDNVCDEHCDERGTFTLKFDELMMLTIRIYRRLKPLLITGGALLSTLCLASVSYELLYKLDCPEGLEGEMLKEFQRDFIQVGKQLGFKDEFILQCTRSLQGRFVGVKPGGPKLPANIPNLGIVKTIFKKYDSQATKELINMVNEAAKKLEPPKTKADVLKNIITGKANELKNQVLDVMKNDTRHLLKASFVTFILVLPFILKSYQRKKENSQEKNTKDYSHPDKSKIKNQKSYGNLAHIKFGLLTETTKNQYRDKRKLNPKNDEKIKILIFPYRTKNKGVSKYVFNLWIPLNDMWAHEVIGWDDVDEQNLEITDTHVSKPFEKFLQ